MTKSKKDQEQGEDTAPEAVEIDTIPYPRAGVVNGGLEAERGGEEGLILADEESTVAALVPRPLGIDVSNHQGIINWAAVPSSGRVFAFAKASEGTGFIDPFFARNWKGMKDAGLLRGAYHFFRPSVDATAQANLFIQQVKRLDPGDLPPVIDVEAHDNRSAAVIVQGIKQWVARVQDALGRDPMIYTGPSFWQTRVGNSNAFSQTLPLWIAHYGVAKPIVPGGWPFHTIHQFTDNGQANGVSGPVDTNRFNGDMAGLRRLAGFP
ncbi:MAG TPA: glycoside hydrolase family 25 protein [Chloroflexia bacterium]|nr:glycoside hydrolase family 25 protein [Chloroflexia bacterium]